MSVEDVRTGRCRLPPSCFIDGLALGDAVLTRREASVCLCSVWHGTERTADNLVTVPAERAPKDLAPDGVIPLGHVRKATLVRISVGAESVDSEALALMVKSMLMGVFVMEGCSINIPPLSLKVEEVAPAGSVVKITSSTQVIVFPRPLMVPVGEGAPGRRLDAPRDIGGLDETYTALLEAVELPLRHGDAFSALGVVPPRGILLHGPSGVGKSSLVRAVAAACGARVHVLHATDVFGEHMGESEEALRRAFRRVEQLPRDAPRVLVIEDVDAIGQRREQERAHENRVVAQLLTLMDGLMRTEGLAIIATTGRPNALDPALRRAGRFDRELSVAVPDEAARLDILRIHTSRLPLASDVALPALASACVGYVGADLAALCREAATRAMGRMAASDPRFRNDGRDRGSSEASASVDRCGALTMGSDQTRGAAEATDRRAADGTARASDFTSDVAVDGAAASGGVAAPVVTMADLREAMRTVLPSLQRETAVRVAPKAWSDIGGLEDTKRRLQQVVEWPLKHPEAFARFGITTPGGLLLYGPPGCSKTTLVRAMCSSARVTFLPVNGAALYSSFLGEAERHLRGVFRQARAGAPAVVFLDEIDAMVGKRGFGSESKGDGGVQERVLSTLLNEMDGVEISRGVIVVAATNRPDMLDSALVRPGRLGSLLYVPPPDERARGEILEIYTRHTPLAPDVDLAAIARATARFTGAELEAVCREAAFAALRASLDATHVTQAHLIAAVGRVTPALQELDLEFYRAFGASAGW